MDQMVDKGDHQSGRREFSVATIEKDLEAGRRERKQNNRAGDSRLQPRDPMSSNLQSQIALHHPEQAHEKHAEQALQEDLQLAHEQVAQGRSPFSGPTIERHCGASQQNAGRLASVPQSIWSQQTISVSI